MTLEAIPYSDVAGQLVRVIRAMDGWLAKAEEHARAKNYDVNVHLVSRLAPDMEAFAFQIQTATDYARSIAG